MFCLAICVRSTLFLDGRLMPGVFIFPSMHLLSFCKILPYSKEEEKKKKEKKTNSPALDFNFKPKS